MPVPIKRSDIAARLLNYPRDNYLYIGNIMKGVAVSTAAITLLLIIPNFPNEWPRITPWLGSFLAILISYMTWGRGILVTNSRSNVWDSVLPLLMGMVEILLFAVLFIDRDHPGDHPDFWLNWFLFISLHAFLAAALVQNRINNTKVNEDFDPEIEDVGKNIKKWMRGDRTGALVFGFFTLGVWSWLKWWVLPRHGVQWEATDQAVAAGILCLCFCVVINKANIQRQLIDATIINKEPK